VRDLQWALRAAPVIAAAALMSACGIFKSNSPGEQVYILHPAGQAAASAGNAAVIDAMLVVPQPEAAAALNTPRIALTQPDNRLDYFADSRWAAPLPQVLGALVVESLIASKTFSVVAGADPSPGHGDFQLLLTVRHFEAEYAGGTSDSTPVARVAIECLLTSTSPRRVVGRCDAEARETAGENRMGEIVAALERAAQKAVTEMGGKVAAMAGTKPP
jgi:cholesterol transport system auxiliary component